ncbi:hypothetical protein HOU71_gp20 [Pectobacterium phage Clickz]|uniref:dATP/dGTP diphosphohydrolase N-terminal domain-containing protein n=8 Tax=Phimunavirus Clickz TaxID=2733338 RepID=A0A3G8FHA3_9CAUD|nr:hypothetical protein HOU71_gp20 [Pectobacterium phage Clickz]AZF94129.1 hypothetical protein [Pectobacterium phage Clickz_B2]AZF94177.1 hypothetical protein [Pectobacterium phage Clickz_B3]AZF94253.1 hypothetical protein [Pectobacterium phage Clickz_B4]AZF94266.1 hypothetical protein [Pectobacterium phage Clickz_B5]AZF94355.1 hypothetical protein [Pectobacterium phage Clickz_B6]AZF94417.1 hypothetical protein [Pectobacterium phage Clickz_B7]AZF94445.1 hypothetical protein [Pectobacterium 
MNCTCDICTPVWGIHAHDCPMNPMSELPTGVKYDQDKPRMDLLVLDCPRALREVSAVMGYGAKKYSEDNWLRVPDASKRYMAAALRHLTAHTSGEELDPESGYSHLAHFASCALFILELEMRKCVLASEKVD